MSKQFLDLTGLTTYHDNLVDYIDEQIPQSDWAQSSSDEKDYIKNKPTLGTASAKDVATSGNASSTQVVMGNDTRLSDSRPASDVSSWAKASTKPTYTASEVGAIATTAKGANNGVAELDSTGKVPSAQLPSFVDDVLEYTNKSSFPATGETGKIYIAQDTNKTYRWSGTAYAEISESLALGETSSTAYYGDKGKIAYNHSQVTSGNPHNVTKSDVGLENVGNFKAVSTVASQGLTSTEQANARANIGAGTSSLTLGTSSATAYRGDYGNTAYSHATDANRLTTAKSEGLYKIATTSEGHVKSATAVAKSDITGLGIPAQDTTYSFASGDANGQLKVTPSGGSASNINIENRRFYGECTTDANVAAKTVTVSDFTTLQTGMTVHVYFKYYNTASSPTLNVNNSGAKAIIKRYSGEDKPTWFGGQVLSFTYNGSKWIMNDAGDIIPAVESSDNSIAISTQVDTVVDPQWHDTTAEFVKKHNLTVNSVDWTKVANKPDVATEQEIASYTEASGSIASFSDGSPLPMRSLKAYIEPVQDLHGYDAPWVGGSGKNKFDIATISVKEYIGGNGILYSSYNWSVSDFISVDSETAYVLSGITNSGSLAKHAFYDSNKVFISAIDSTVMNFTTPSNAKYIRLSLQSETPTNVQLEKGSTATTFAPYSNICPISGWDEVNVARTGKNLFGGIDFANAVKDASPSGAIDTTNKTVTYSYGTGSKTTIFDTFKPLTSYTFLFKVADCGGQNFSMRIVYTDGTVEGIEILPSDIGNYVRKVSNPNKTVSELAVMWYQSTIVKLYYDECGIFEGNIQTTDFTSYQGQTYEVDLGSTRYGGTLDVVSGVLTITHGYIASYNGETLPSTWISDRDVYAEGTTPTIGAEVCYELATPQTYQLTPTQVKSLLGVNNVWADTGDVELEYQPQNVIAELRGEILKVEEKTPSPVYGFHISDGESDPSEKVTYIADALGMTPAHMDYIKDTFYYGSWKDVWFVRDCKPCILGQDGVVRKYLDPNDYSKDIDGNTVTIDSTLTGANVMIEFPKIWYKVVPDRDDDSSGSIYISPVKVDADYKDYAYIDYQGNHKEHFYMPAYNGTNISSVLRSVSDAQVMKTQTRQTEITYATANGAGWYTEDAGEVMLINFLLILMGKSTDTQTVFGQGLSTGGAESLNDGFRTGVHNQKGLFYGKNSGKESSTTYTNAVKVFGIENWWGFQWRAYAGDVLDNGKRLIKLCHSTEDGSSTFGFNIDGAGYINVGKTPSGTSSGYISKMVFTHDGMYSSVSSGSSTTHYCDGQWFDNSYHTIYAIRGGSSGYGSHDGAFCVSLYSTPGDASWYFGAAPSYK